MKGKRRPWYCFRCGEDGHIAPYCCGDPNPELVEAKKKELKEKLQLWEKANSESDNASLD